MLYICYVTAKLSTFKTLSFKVHAKDKLVVAALVYSFKSKNFSLPFPFILCKQKSPKEIKKPTSLLIWWATKDNMAYQPIDKAVLNHKDSRHVVIKGKAKTRIISASSRWVVTLLKDNSVRFENIEPEPDEAGRRP